MIRVFRTAVAIAGLVGGIGFVRAGLWFLRDARSAGTASDGPLAGSVTNLLPAAMYGLAAMGLGLGLVLLPGPRDRAGVAMHMKLCDLEFSGPARSILVPKRFLPKEQWKLEPMERARAKIEKHLSILEAEIRGKEYLAGDRFTLADVCY